MEQIILRTNAIPVYGFLSYIKAFQTGEKSTHQKKILDCGAGGAIPPLALFAQHGFEACGIDVSEEQLQKANGFCEQHGIRMDLQKGDMRQIPYEDETFDYVYEQFSMCHLSKLDTALAIGEMYRVLKPGGLCLLGLISSDCWPKSQMGIEREPGEYWGDEGGEERAHSLFTDEEADNLLSAWEVISKEKQVNYHCSSTDRLTAEEWMNSYKEAGRGYSREAWKARYQSNAGEFQYAHLYFCLRKL